MKYNFRNLEYGFRLGPMTAHTHIIASYRRLTGESNPSEARGVSFKICAAYTHFCILYIEFPFYVRECGRGGGRERHLSKRRGKNVQIIYLFIPSQVDGFVASVL